MTSSSTSVATVLPSSEAGASDSAQSIVHIHDTTSPEDAILYSIVNYVLSLPPESTDRDVSITATDTIVDQPPCHSLPDTRASPPPEQNKLPPSMRNNPYRMLFRPSVERTEPLPVVIPPPSTYETFWSNFRGLHAASKQVPNDPNPMFQFNATQHERRWTPSPATSDDESEVPVTRKRKSPATFEDVLLKYPEISNHIKITRRECRQRFICKCNQAVNNDVRAINDHAELVHGTTDQRSEMTCLVVGCEFTLQAANMGEHVAAHLRHIRFLCGLCENDFSAYESVIAHLVSGACKELQAADSALGIQRPTKRARCAVID